MSANLTTVIVAGVLGVAGTSIGGFLASRSSVQSQRLNAQLTREQGYLRELRTAVTEFCTATMIYRGAELDRWEAWHDETRESQKPTNARVYETRTAARDALYRVELSTASEKISNAVRAAFEATKSIKEAQTESEVKTRRNEVEQELARVMILVRQILGVQDI